MGQMSFWQDEPDDTKDPVLYETDDSYEPPIDAVFDREQEARGYQ